MAAVFRYINGKREDAVYKTTMDTFIQSFHEGMLSYSMNSSLANNNFASASAANVSAFMNPGIVALSGTFLTPRAGNLNGLVRVTVNPARDANGNAYRRYKVLFDITQLASSNSWSPEQIQKAENEIAKFFTNITPDGLIVAGATATLPAATSDASAAAPNTDGLIVLDRVK